MFWIHLATSLLQGKLLMFEKLKTSVTLVSMERGWLTGFLVWVFIGFLVAVTGQPTFTF